ncbi:MAG: hypothetical protein R2860_11090 [Desulfobacterales bacterium]
MFAALAVVGLLGFLAGEVTVISVILSPCTADYHYGDHSSDCPVSGTFSHYPDKFQHELVLETVRLKLTPCIYAALTTIAGFGSLLTCDIYPVITFGWMMVGGIIVSLVCFPYFSLPP